jgi:hypothetical protein
MTCTTLQSEGEAGAFQGYVAIHSICKDIDFEDKVPRYFKSGDKNSQNPQMGGGSLTRYCDKLSRGVA